jgi:death-on-curing protein
MLTLTPADILSIHEALAADFAAASDPISPSGIKSMDLLESAVSRQSTGYEGRMKYETAHANAAALTYGICLNHPFFNGNKRTALVSMLCHLDRDDRTFEAGVTHDDLYAFMLKVASHGFAEKGRKGDQSDIEVEQMARWIRNRTRAVERGERVITFRELRAILANFGFGLEGLRNNSVDLVRYEEWRGWLGFGKKQTKPFRIMRMGYPGDGAVVGKRQIKDLRDRCRLSQEHGVDSHAFYSKEKTPIDYFVQNYRGLLRRLARV